MSEPTLEQVESELAERSFAHFYPRAWKIVEPGRSFLRNWHIDCIAEHLTAVTDGQIRRLVINVPPRTGKSQEVTVCWPCWSWLKRPAMRWMFVSYSADLSALHSVYRRTLLQSDWYRRHWGTRFGLNKWQEAELRNDKQGAMFATSIGGSATGRGGDVIVIDDPHNPRQAESEAERATAIRFCQQTLATRLDDPKTGAVVVVMQRLHEKDWSGHVLAEGGYTHLCLPAEAESRTTISFPASGRTIEREEGDLLWPERYGETELASLKKAMGSYAYAGQFQQWPAPAGGEVFQRSWFRYWTLQDDIYHLDLGGGRIRRIAAPSCTRLAFLDVASSDEQSADYTVMQVWDITPEAEMILVDQWRERAQSPTVINTAAAMARRYATQMVGVEANGVGLGVYQALRGKGVTVRKLVAKGDKKSRTRVAAQARMEAGTVFFPARSHFITALERELLLFPNAENDDQVDALSHAAIHVQKMNGPVQDRDDMESQAEEINAIEGMARREVEENEEGLDGDIGWTEIDLT